MSVVVRRGLPWRGVALAGLVFLAALLGPASAGQAALVHELDGYFGGGTLAVPEALAVDQTSGDVYVLEHGNGCVSRFHGERGGPEALEPHDFPATGTNQVCGFEFREEPSNAQIAIDNSGTSTEGTFYVNSPATNGGFGGTKSYDVDGNFLTELTPFSSDGGLVYVCGVTTDADGNVYVVEHYAGVQKYNHDDPVTNDDAEYAGYEGPACGMVQTSGGSRYLSWDSNGPLIHNGSVLRDTSYAIDLDRSTDEVYVSEGDRVSGITGEGIEFDRFGSGDVSGARGVAIDAETGIAYVSDTPNGRIGVFTGSPAYRLGVDFTGTGVGAVSSSAPPIEDCGDEGQCVGYYPPSTVVLTASPQAHSVIDGWTGCDEISPGGDECTVEVTGADREVLANFTRLQQTVTASTAGTGTGSVSDTDLLGAIQGCGGAGGSCSGPYDEGSAITLTATPTGHSTFTGWSGACTNESGPCEVVVEGAPSVTAHFTAQHGVSVKKAGTGAGAVVSEPSGIDCGGVCVGYFTDGETITLSPVPSGHSTFTGWSGSNCSGTGVCQVEVGDATKTVTATFAHDTPSVVTDPGATFVGQRVATVHGSVDPNGAAVTRCAIEFGVTQSYGSERPCAPSGVGNGEAFVPVGANLTGLEPGTVYHYRLVAANVGGTGFGADQTFRTLDDTCDSNQALCPPIVSIADPQPSRCRKGQVRKKGRCVKKRKARKKSRRHPVRRGDRR
jgi:hypothetical protein